MREMNCVHDLREFKMRLPLYDLDKSDIEAKLAAVKWIFEAAAASWFGVFDLEFCVVFNVWYWDPSHIVVKSLHNQLSKKKTDI